MSAQQHASSLLQKKKSKNETKSKYIVDRVHGFVKKNHLFRKVKFITKQKMLDEVIKVVEEMARK